MNTPDEPLEPPELEPVEPLEPAPAPSSRTVPELFGPPKPPPSPVMVLEAAFLCLGHGLTMDQLKTLFANEYGAKQLKSFIAELQADWQARGMGIELFLAEDTWKLRMRPEFADVLAHINPDASPRYSKAVLETLAVIAYKQPVTRRTIEEQRGGVSVSPAVLEQLENRGWIEVIGHQESPGKPALYATTFKFLDDLGLQTLADMPLLPGEGPLVLPEAPVEGLDFEADAYEPYDGPIEGQAVPWSPDQYAPPLATTTLFGDRTEQPLSSAKPLSAPTEVESSEPPGVDPLFAPLEPLPLLPELEGLLSLGPLPELPPLPAFMDDADRSPTEPETPEVPAQEGSDTASGLVQEPSAPTPEHPTEPGANKGPDLPPREP